MKKFRYWIVLIIIAYGFMELLSYGGLFFLNKFRHVIYEPADILSNTHADIIDNYIKEKTNYKTFSSTLGWSIKKNGTSKLYQANSSGIRSSREYVLHPPNGIRRISTFGDSFTHSSDVKNDETWEAFMESLDPNMEVLNFGVGAYGLDQAYLRYLEDGRQYRSQIVLIGFMSRDIYRTVNTFRPFFNSHTGTPLAKPRFKVKDKKLLLIPNHLDDLHDYRTLLLNPKKVLSQLGVNDYYYQKRYTSNIFDWSPLVRATKILINQVSNKLTKETIILNGRYNENAEAYIVTKKIFDEFYNKVITDKATPIILIFPTGKDLGQYKRLKETQYSPLLSYFDSRGYQYIDLVHAFENADGKDLFDGHYTPFANRLVAKHIHKILKNMSNRENE